MVQKYKNVLARRIKAKFHFHTVPYIGLQCVILVFPGHIHLLFSYKHENALKSM